MRKTSEFATAVKELCQMEMMRRVGPKCVLCTRALGFFPLGFPPKK